MRFITLSKVKPGLYNEDTGTTDEASDPVLVNVACIRCFYARRDSRPGTRLTFNDGGGFAVSEPLDAVTAAVTLN